jgi:prolyl oligopeptidase
MYILRKNSTVLNGTTPTLLWGYGGFAVSSLPEFSPKSVAFVDNFNGIYALANIRGGGEYGKKWYDEGSKLKKQNSFDDFQAAAEYLIHNNYTSASKLTIEGASNGGLLVGACVNQRPELFGAAIAEVGVMDMIRIGKTEIGIVACSEYGCPDNKETFETLLKYSPLHNIRLPSNESVQYPAVLIITADRDDRVPPWQSYKYAAELQHTIGLNPRQTNPLLLLVEKNAGHEAGKPTSKKIEEATHILSFIAETLNLDFEASATETN